MDTLNVRCADACVALGHVVGQLGSNAKGSKLHTTCTENTSQNAKVHSAAAAVSTDYTMTQLSVSTIK